MRNRNRLSRLAERLWAPALLLFVVAGSGYIVSPTGPLAGSPEAARSASAAR